MSELFKQKKLLAVFATIALLAAAFIWVLLSSGPLAKIKIVMTQVQEQRLQPALFGIGTVEARYTYRIASNTVGRAATLNVDVGDRVAAGDILGIIDVVDLDDKINAQAALVERNKAQLSEAQTRLDYTGKQAQRYRKLLPSRSVSEELDASKQHEWALARSQASSASSELARAQAELLALQAVRADRYLRAPVAGLIIARHIDPGATVLAGQTVFELIDPLQLWVDVRFDQAGSMLLAQQQPAQIILRSQELQPHSGHVARLEWLADAVTEERRAKVMFSQQPQPTPSIGELAEVTVQLPQLASSPVLSNAAILRQDGQLGVWLIDDQQPVFQPVSLGRSDLDGNVQILSGLSAGQQVVLYSSKALTANSRIKYVEQLVDTP
ncbi:MAG: efflux RND transporter periplasmic adaptor subunit [Pseudomonas sp.]|jgi:RND family efflux transporter MFP subunit|nr:efflux RND transporter periplasmic adaptor subunit [Pseudomonas sp.]MDD2222346.1 efflux RND transporter periplasmic adaptor subunit [Pseudomonas sp.]MDY0413620.1 efflux RND transporter periplasmic adaptor subunit [Pseudomonas sp.]NLO54741.1 efflux RND transporter periplasmic adaptor subunit [Gammaproteobacteria bacterium]